MYKSSRVKKETFSKGLKNLPPNLTEAQFLEQLEITGEHSDLNLIGPGDPKIDKSSSAQITFLDRNYGYYNLNACQGKILYAEDKPYEVIVQIAPTPHPAPPPPAPPPVEWQSEKTKQNYEKFVKEVLSGKMTFDEIHETPLARYFQEFKRTGKRPTVNVPTTSTSPGGEKAAADLESELEIRESTLYPTPAPSPTTTPQPQVPSNSNSCTSWAVKGHLHIPNQGTPCFENIYTHPQGQGCPTPHTSILYSGLGSFQLIGPPGPEPVYEQTFLSSREDLTPPPGSYTQVRAVTSTYGIRDQYQQTNVSYGHSTPTDQQQQEQPAPASHKSAWCPGVHIPTRPTQTPVYTYAQTCYMQQRFMVYGAPVGRTMAMSGSAGPQQHLDLTPKPSITQGQGEFFDEQTSPPMTFQPSNKDVLQEVETGVFPEEKSSSDIDISVAYELIPCQESVEKVLAWKSSNLTNYDTSPEFVPETRRRPPSSTRRKRLNKVRSQELNNKVETLPPTVEEKEHEAKSDVEVKDKGPSSSPEVPLKLQSPDSLEAVSSSEEGNQTARSWISLSSTSLPSYTGDDEDQELETSLDPAEVSGQTLSLSPVSTEELGFEISSLESFPLTTDEDENNEEDSSKSQSH